MKVERLRGGPPWHPAEVAELRPILESWHRGGSHATARLFVAVCPNDHTVLSVYSTAGGPVIYTSRHRHGADHGPAAALLTDSPRVWWIECPCRLLAVETTWVAEQVEAPTRRGIVPPAMIPRALMDGTEDMPGE